MLLRILDIRFMESRIDFIKLVILLILLRSISIFALLTEKFERPQTIEKKSKIYLYKYKDFLVYLSPWIMFALASSLGRTINPQIENFDNLRYIFIAIFGQLQIL